MIKKSLTDVKESEIADKNGIWGDWMTAHSVGFWVRFLAYLIDGLLVGVPITIIAVTFWDLTNGAMVFVQIGLFFYYLLVPLFTNGYTVGKRMLEIRIVKTNRESIRLETMVLRVFISGLIYALSLGIAVVVSMIMVAVRKDQRALHDLIAGTDVKVEQK